MVLCGNCGHQYHPPRGCYWRKCDCENPFVNFTERELEVLRLIAKGIGEKQIAYRLGIAHPTVQNHKNQMFQKTGAHSSLQIVAFALHMGILTLDDLWKPTESMVHAFQKQSPTALP